MAERKTKADKSHTHVEPMRSIGFELRKTDRAVEADLQSRLASVGLQIGMWLYLRSLWFEDGLMQSELSRRVGSSKPTTLEQLRRMEQRGLVRLERNTADRRVVRAQLTAEGMALKGKLLPFAKLNHDAALAGFTGAEVEALLDALRRIRHNVARKSPSRVHLPAGLPAADAQQARTRAAGKKPRVLRLGVSGRG